jgi:enamine deaminase RidA (YjgF/YER057c/UK114 family)
MKMVFATSSGETSESNNIQQHSNTAFNQLQNILSEEKMAFSDVVRQWNYIEKITVNVNHNNSTSQHYQIFNDVRSKFYQQASFSTGFPAATGIGMDYGGIIIDIIAVQFGNKGSVIAVKNPVQLDAYTYSTEVLAENNTMSDFCRTTPKFERAKILITPENKWVFISGTAAIKGQVSNPGLSAEQQTEMTIQNILNLISPENLKKYGIEKGEKMSMSHVRVYVKNRADVQQVKAICLKYFPHIPVVYFVADICRPELLVEIEGQAVII